MLESIHLMTPTVVFCFTFAITAILIVWFFDLGFQFGLVDLPGGRKKHMSSVPLVGGIAIFLGVSLSLHSFLFTNAIIFAYWISGLFLTCVCVMDDKEPLPSTIRFFVQFLAVLIIILLGKTAILSLGNLIGTGSIVLGLLSIPVTCFAMMGIINAVNMMDGIDGLTGGVSCVEFSILFLLALKAGASQEMLLIVSFIGAILAFLLFNFPGSVLGKKKIFLGDAGSMLIGLTLAWLCVRLTQGQNAYSPAVMLWVMALPLMDTLHLIINRKARGVSAFRGDRRHIHHILLHLNYAPRHITLILMGLSLLFGTMGLLMCFNGASDWVLFLGFVVLFLTYSTLSLGLKKMVTTRKNKDLVVI